MHFLIRRPNICITMAAFVSGFSFFVSVLLGFGGFNFLDFFNYSISGFVSKSQMFFLGLTTISIFILSLGWYVQSNKSKIQKFLLLLYFFTILIFSVTIIIGLTSQTRNTDFWAQTVFVETNITLLFNNLTLLCFLSLGILQTILSILFFSKKINENNPLSNVKKSLILISGILFLIKTIMDYPFLKEAIFILSFMIKIPILNNIISFLSPIFFLIAQIQLAKILVKK